jgi:uncharacterized RDD family membrane protein YckC
MRNLTTKRAFAFFIDAFFITLITFVIMFITYSKFRFSIEFIYLLVWFLYFFALEFFFQKTLGKLILGLKVVITHSTKPNFLLFVLRTVSRLIPIDVIPLILSNDNRCWHDRLSKTKVETTF